MIRRNKRYTVTHRDATNELLYSPCETTQLEPNLRELLVKYQQGLDITDHVYLPAAKATADVQFKNRVAKVDPLTEIPQYIAGVKAKAEAAVTSDRKRSRKLEQKDIDSPTTASENA